MDHIPGGEIASQLPMFIDPTMIVDSVLAGSWDAADALGNSPYVSVTPRCNPSSGVGHRHPTDVVRTFSTPSRRLARNSPACGRRLRRRVLNRANL
jgi:hypothetical protein